MNADPHLTLDELVWAAWLLDRWGFERKPWREYNALLWCHAQEVAARDYDGFS